MDIVVDASVLIAVVANQPEKDQLIALTSGADLIAPASVHWEIGNAFSAMLKRGRVTLPQAIQAIQLYGRIPVRFAQVELDESIQIAAEQKLYAYDAYLICCSLTYDAPLLSLDRNLLRAAQARGARAIEVNR